MKTTDDRSDTDLLLAYGRDGEEAAFEALARRHVDMIFSVSLRRANNRQLAEEATQNVLLSLSRKARKLSAGESNLTAWLHTSTKFEVAKLRRRESRIRNREQAYASENMNTSTQDEEQAFQRLYPLLDQAIDDLRTPDREVIVRRYLEGQSFGRIGQALGISEDAAQKRTSRAFEQLNQFFKRKAGVTVSATALTAGISQHCVEAAPASCLNILTNTAAAGAASGLATSTIITVLSTNKIAAVVAGIALLGGAAALITTRDQAPTQTPASQAEEAASPPLPSAAEGATVRTKTSERPVVADAGSNTGEAEEYSPNKELARLEAMNPHPGKDEFARRLSVKHDRLLKDLTEDLGLSAAQVASVKQTLDTRLEAFRAALDTGPQPGDPEQESFRKEAEMIASAGEIIRGAGLRDDLKAIISAGQLTAFDGREAEAWQSQVESHAYTEFSKLVPALGMSEEQKDRVFGLLQASSAEILKTDADERAFIAMQKGQASTQMDMPDPVEMDFIIEALEGPNPMRPDSPEFKERAFQVIGARIDERVGLLAPVLDEQQKQRYREYLVKQSMLSQFPAELPKPE